MAVKRKNEIFAVRNHDNLDISCYDSHELALKVVLIDLLDWYEKAFELEDGVKAFKDLKREVIHLLNNDEVEDLEWIERLNVYGED